MDFTLNTGNTAWILMAAALVLLMTPGLAFFYGGMVGSTAVLNIMMMSFGAIGVVGVIYVLWGYSATFGPDLAGVVGNPLHVFGLRGLTDAAPSNLLAGRGVPAAIWVGFQATFAIIAVALVSGAIPGRVKFGAWLMFAAVWVTFSYFPLAHMVWGGGLLSGAPTGIAARLFGLHAGAATTTPIDFAGGTVVHINAGVAGLVLALVIGQRKGFGTEPFRPHNLPFVMLGAALLWFGWFGFNAGSAGGADGVAATAWLNTAVAACAAMLGWLVTEKFRDGHPTSLGAASGVVAGLVAITPAAAALSATGAIVLGLVAGVLCALAVGLKYRFGVDDSLDVVGVHLVGGLVGTVLVGFLATDTGLFYGGGFRQLAVQLVIAVVAMAVSATVTLVIALVIRATTGWRVSPEVEADGIDLAIHGESAYENASSGRTSTGGIG